MKEKSTGLILSIDTSCDETAAAVTSGRRILANVVWSQASAHAKFGGVMPSVAQRMHRERIELVINKAIRRSGHRKEEMAAIAVTAGPGLAIALEVGISEAKKLAGQIGVPVIAVNHIEGHLWSCLSGNSQRERMQLVFPMLGLVVSGGHTDLVEIMAMNEYRLLARTEDDAIGEAMDKAARMLGLGYPGGAFLEQLAKQGDRRHYPLPLPMAGKEDRLRFSYSGLKTAMWRTCEKVNQNEKLGKMQIADLAASFEQRAIQHLTRVCEMAIQRNNTVYKGWLVGGGVSANMKLRSEIRKLSRQYQIPVWFPINKRLCGDNAAMIGIVAGEKMMQNRPFAQIGQIDRWPRWRIDEKPESIISKPVSVS